MSATQVLGSGQDGLRVGHMVLLHSRSVEPVTRPFSFILARVAFLPLFSLFGCSADSHFLFILSLTPQGEYYGKRLNETSLFKSDACVPCPLGQVCLQALVCAAHTQACTHRHGSGYNTATCTRINIQTFTKRRCTRGPRLMNVYLSKP